MSEIKMVIIQGPNFERHSLGLFDLEIIPRIGEYVFYEKEGDDGPSIYKVRSIIHNIKPKLPAEVSIVSQDDEKYHNR